MQPDELLDRLRETFADRQLFVVGGCLRDQLLGRAVNDLDLATEARPEEVRRRVGSWADSVWTVGEEFGTVAMAKGGAKAEITTFRSDRYDGVSRKPEVAFGDSIEGDLSRRDFTVNAMARDAQTGELLDPYGGQQDLADRLLRFVGDAATRIREDPLRMLRAVRFCTQLGFELDPAGAAAVAEHAEEIRRISWERIRDELDAVLLSERPDEGLRLALDLGLARHLLPELERLHLPEPARHHMKDLLQHTLDTVRLTPGDKVVRYAALLHDIAKPETYSRDDAGVHFHRHEKLGAERARDMLLRLRQPIALANRVAHLVENHLRVPYYRPEWTDSAVRRLMYDLGGDLERALQLAEADVRASDPVDYPEFQESLRALRSRIESIGEAAEIAEMKPLLDGNEVMELLGIEPGPEVGEVLDFLLDQQLEGTVTTREEAAAAVRRRFAAESD